MAFWTEGGRGLLMDGQKLRRLTQRFDATHDLLSPPGVSMRRLGAVVQPLVRAVLDLWAKSPYGVAIAAQLVGHDNLGDAPSSHQFSEKSLGSMGVPATFDQDLQHVAVRVDRPPKPVLLTSD